MTNREAIKILKQEWQCIDRNDGTHCNRVCDQCDLVEVSCRGRISAIHF